MIPTGSPARASMHRPALLVALALVLSVVGWTAGQASSTAPSGEPETSVVRFQDDDDDSEGDDGVDDDGAADFDDDDGFIDDGGFDDDDDFIDDDGDPTTDGYRAGQATVRLRDGAAIEAFHLRQGTFTLGAIPDRGLYLVAFSTAESADAAVARLAADPDAVWAELNHISQAPEGRPGYLFVSGQPDADAGLDYAGDLIGLPAALACASGGGVVVAVLDTGVDTANPALAGRILSRGYNALDGSANTLDWGDGIDDDGDGFVDEMSGHGTHVAGIVLAVAPGATILPVKVLDTDGVGNAFVLAAGIYYAIAEHADVINLSLGSTADARVVREAIAAAAEAGIVVVAAAGNADRPSPVEHPAAHPAALAIAATDADDRKSAFSNYGEHIALTAPGTEILSTVPGQGYGSWSGTSMATPFAAAAAALLLGESPNLTPDEVRSRLVASAAGLDAANPDHAGALGAGRLDLAAAIDCG